MEGLASCQRMERVWIPVCHYIYVYFNVYLFLETSRDIHLGDIYEYLSNEQETPVMQ